MRTLSLHTWITTGSVAVIGITIVTAFFLTSGGQPRTSKALRIDRQKIAHAGSGIAAPSTNLIRDFFRLKYGPAQTAEFHVTSSQPMAIFVRATGVQIRTDSGWQPSSEEPRNEIWRLKPGVTREMFVERPPREAGQIWRAYVLYGTEMKGPRLLKAQLREAWLIRSFTNWTGQPWGGGHFSEKNEWFSEEFSD